MLVEELTVTTQDTPACHAALYRLLPESTSSANRYLFADPAIASTFLSTIEIATQEAAVTEITAGDSLLVFAHALTPACPRHSDHGGLHWLESGLIEYGWIDVKIYLFGFLAREMYGQYAYLVSDLTVHYQQLPKPMTELEPVYSFTLLDRKMLRFKASERQLEVLFASERHKFAGKAAAIRIYLGFLATTDRFDAVAAKDILRKMARTKEVTIEPRALLKRIEHHRMLAADRVLRNQIPAIYRQRGGLGKVWMLDDQVRSHFWHKILHQIFGGTNVVYRHTWKQFKRVLGKIGPNDTVILDCNLGDHSAYNGLEIISAIRHRFPEINLVFMSSYDDAQVALTALRAGANAYFVKELADANDRGSVDYYAGFIRRFRLGRDQRKLMELWRDYYQIQQPLVAATEGEVLPPTLNEQLKTAFYIGFNAAERSSLLQQHILSPSWRWDNAAGRSMVDVLLVGWPENTGPSAWNNIKDFARKTGHDFAISVKDIAGMAKHGSVVSLADAIFVLETIVHRLRRRETTDRRWGEPCLPPFCPYTREDLRADGKYPGQSGGERRSDHSEAGRRAARELMIGCYGDAVDEFTDFTMSQYLEVNYSRVKWDNWQFNDILVLDDEDNNGWFEALRHIMPNITTCKINLQPDLSAEETHKQLAKDLAGVKIRNTSLAIIDMKMPDADQGFAVLKYLRAKDPKLPIIVASASTETLNAESALRHGAIDYISKSLPFSRNLEQCKELYLRLLTSILLGRDMGQHAARDLHREVRRLAFSAPPRLALRWHDCQHLSDPIEVNDYHNILHKTATLYYPPEPADWVAYLQQHLSLLIGLYSLWYTADNMRCFCLSVAGDEAAAAERFGGASCNDQARLLRVDDWRQSTILGKFGAHTNGLLVISAYSLLETLAQWRWCFLIGKRQMVKEYWGIGINTDVAQHRISIEHQMTETFRGRHAAIADLRNDVVHHGGSELLQDNTFGEKLIRKMLECIKHYFDVNNGTFNAFR